METNHEFHELGEIYIGELGMIMVAGREGNYYLNCSKYGPAAGFIRRLIEEGKVTHMSQIEGSDFHQYGTYFWER